MSDDLKREILQIQSRLKELTSHNIPLALIAEKSGISVDSLKSFIYKLSENPKKGETYNSVMSFFQKLDRNEISIFGKSPFEYLNGNYFVYRKSLIKNKESKNNIVKAHLSVFDCQKENISCFSETIRGVYRKRIVKGTVQKFATNLYFDGQSYISKNHDDAFYDGNDEEISHSNAIGKEIIMFSENFLYDFFIRANFFSVSGDFKPICGSCLIFRTHIIDVKCPIGNYDCQEMMDTFQGQKIDDIFSQFDEIGRPIQTVSN